MVVRLEESLFENNKYVVQFTPTREAEFTIVDDTFGVYTPVRVNTITVFIRTIGTAEGQRYTSVIGIGNQVVGVRTSVPALRGKVLDRENMSQCEVLLYNDDGSV